MYCKNCGKQIENNSRFCNYCGASQGEMRAAEEGKAAGLACAEAAGRAGAAPGMAGWTGNMPGIAGRTRSPAGGGRGAILRWLVVAALFLAAIMGMAVVMPSLLGGLAQKMG